LEDKDNPYSFIFQNNMHDKGIQIILKILNTLYGLSLSVISLHFFFFQEEELKGMNNDISFLKSS